MNILITGITGFVGQNLKKYIDKYSSCYTIGISRKADGESVKSYQALTPEFWNQTTAFIHLAGKAHDLKNTSEDEDYFEVNTELTKKLFDQFLGSTCETFIYMSSVKAVADEVAGVLDESLIPSPVTAYGKSKLAAEEYILSQKLPKGKRVYILRPCMIHGPGNKGNLNLLYDFVKKGIPYPFGKYNNQRSFLSVENLCFVIKELIENKDIPSGVYNISDDQTLSTNELVETMGEVLQKPVRILKIPKLLVRGISKIGDLLPLPVNSERLQKLTENYVVSNRKIVDAMEKELPFTVREGLRKTTGSFGKNI
jgi:nucleoside-diphosphate-sugar epimerase